MKTIKKLRESSKAVAGTALLVGATIAGGAAMVSADNHGSSGYLDDYPQPFINDDGEVASTLVMGEDAKATDVVAATEIAGQLGNDAFRTETQTVAVEGVAGSWSATGGITLDTANDDIYFGQSVNEVRSTLTESDLDLLQEVTFRDDSGTTYDISHNLNVGELDIEFSNEGDELDDEDPVVNVQLPSEGEVTDDDEEHLVHLQATLDTIDITDPDVAGEDIELFGTEYTIASDNEDVDDEDYLLLYGSQEEVDVQTGESTTITVDGNEHTIEVVSTNAGEEQASIRVDGSLSQRSVGQTFSVGGQEVRLDEVINLGATDDGDGIAQFAIGSEELRIHDGDQIEDDDGDDYEGTYAVINGDDEWERSDEMVSSIDIYLGAEDDDEDALVAGETFSHSLFEQVEVHFGGLNPDATDADQDGVGAIEVSQAGGGDEVEVDFTTRRGHDASITFTEDTDVDDEATDELPLRVDEDEPINVIEGAEMQEDHYFTASPGDFTRMFQVTDIDYEDGDATDTEVEIEDTVTGQSFEVDRFQRYTDDDTHDVHVDREIIDGQTYWFAVEDEEVAVSWGSGATADSGNDSVTDSIDVGDTASVFSRLDTEEHGAISFVPGEAETVSTDAPSEQQIGLPSTLSTDDAYFTVASDTDSLEVGSNVNLEVTEDYEETSDTTNDQALYDVTVNGGQTYEVLHNNDDDTVTFNPLTDDGGPVVQLHQPENDDDVEHVYTAEAVYGADDDDDTGVEEAVYTGDRSDPVDLESDDDIAAAVDFYGAYSEYDSDDEGEFLLHQPAGQATAGVAVTEQDGSLSAEGGGSDSVDTQVATGWPAQSVALDSDDFIPEAKTDRNLILVGGPAANSLVQELADEDRTWEVADYTEGEGLLQLVPEAFSEDHDALIVAGYTGEDTREAGNFLSNYAQHQDELAGQTQLEISTATGSVVE